MPREDIQHVAVEDDGQTYAKAEIRPIPGEVPTVQVSMHVESGQLPPSTRARLVDAVLDSPDVVAGTELHATIPAGDGEMLDQMRERCTMVDARRAGTSCLVHATVHDA